MEEKRRCGWVNGKEPLYVAYHDREWGVPVKEDGKLYEMFLLETFQAGLSWITILKKRENFRAAFHGFDPERIARYGESDIARLLSDKGIIRCERKIRAAIRNAGIFLEIQREFGSFSAYLWGFVNGTPVAAADGPIPATTPLSDKISRDMIRRGMGYVGSVTVYSYLQAVGVANDHEPACFLCPGRG